MIICVILAYRSEQNTRAALQNGQCYSAWNDLAYIALAVVLVLFAGLRRGYNDSPLSSKRQKNICMTRHLATGAIF